MKYNIDGAARGTLRGSSFAFWLRDVQVDLLYAQGAPMEDVDSVWVKAIAILQEANYLKRHREPRSLLQLSL